MQIHGEQLYTFGEAAQAPDPSSAAADPLSQSGPDKLNLGGRLGFIFGGLSFLCLIYLWFYQPETVGRTYEELDEMFLKNTPARKFETYQTDA